MSSNTAAIEPLVPARRPVMMGAPAPEVPERARPERERRTLRLVPQPTARPGHKTRPVVFYAIVVVATVAALIGAQLMLSIALSSGAYQISSLQGDQRDLSRIKDVIQQDIDRYSSPQNLANDAYALGMVPDSNPAYLRLSDGSLIGTAAGAATAPVPNNIPNELAASLPGLQSDGGQTDGTSEAAPAAPEATSTTPTTAPTTTDPATTAPASTDPATTNATTTQQPAAPQPYSGQLPGPSTH